jgi:7,8-dihydroneopterin aldolase/epimerase/oxygenase
MADRVELRGVRVWAHVGADPGEQEVPQPLDVELAVEVDLRAARASDALADAVDYRALFELVRAVAARERVALLERLGEKILAAVMSDPRIVRARVALAKPRLFEGATPAVVLHAER